jgi:hypothetical protein
MTDYRVSAGEAQEDQSTAAIEADSIECVPRCGPRFHGSFSRLQNCQEGPHGPFRRSVGCAFPHIGHLQQTREAAWIRRQHSDCCTVHC